MQLDAIGFLVNAICLVAMNWFIPSVRLATKLSVAEQALGFVGVLAGGAALLLKPRW